MFRILDSQLIGWTCTWLVKRTKARRTYGQLDGPRSNAHMVGQTHDFLDDLELSTAHYDLGISYIV